VSRRQAGGRYSVVRGRRGVVARAAMAALAAHAAAMRQLSVFFFFFFFFFKRREVGKNALERWRRGALRAVEEEFGRKARDRREACRRHAPRPHQAMGVALRRGARVRPQRVVEPSPQQRRVTGERTR